MAISAAAIAPLRRRCALAAPHIARRGVSALAVVPRLGGARPGAFAPSGLQLSRRFSAASNAVKVLASEIKHEEEQYEQAKEIKNFLKNSPFKLVETPGDVNMASDAEGGEGGEEMSKEATELTVTVENKKGGGMIFYCSTQTGEDHRFVIGSVRTYATAEEKERSSSYHGPEFEDLDDKLQEALDEYLAELGMCTEICDFVDAMAVDKEQREYVQWLKVAKSVLEA
eukprot:CAMPEP_0177555800 /NCGR_PEP_ID=MMETSP0369-20130122/68742_1 /TAXON_ID=447022 ORGANISM="Scrippsiella hangoei-like, Strain SHHI-4" /NCGR_SAMPLE_ID=MMETSP0369 /ASSEMBLY_ACC=CAM_ASM_000364 /LENGTH=226 /DNA_ID=CAMNT_0019041979 /DNA_START=72 /DNA_END=753 /DNA_ORIENTATION=+